MGGFYSTTTSRVTIQNLLKKYPNITTRVRKFPLSAQWKYDDDGSTYCFHFNDYDEENSCLSFTDNHGVRLLLDLGGVCLRTLVMDERMPDAVVA